MADFDFVRAFRLLQATYPGVGRGGGALVESTFVQTLLREPDGPAAAFAQMMENLETQVRGDQFTRGYVPKMLNWLREGRWCEQHTPAQQTDYQRRLGSGTSQSVIEEAKRAARARQQKETEHGTGGRVYTD